MAQKIQTKWTGEMAFETQIGDHTITMDADPSVGGQNTGVRPKPLLVASLMGCTGMDVVSLMKKMRVEVDDFSLETETEMSSEHPKVYTSIKLTYRFKGKNIDRSKIEKIVNLTQEKYCGVNAMLKQATALTFAIEIKEN